ncbi:MAG: putative helicase, UvrD / type, partial [Clostridia bacterium]|nr:putative helicase, UvrD / type [Clostridia bacterium]
MNKLLKNLNEEQRKAAEHTTGPCMVLAGPGTGKTTIIVHRLAQLIHSKTVSPDNLLVVTFSKDAAAEMKERFVKFAIDHKVANSRQIGEITFGTFHSVFFKILRQYENYKLENLLDEGEKFLTIKGIARKLQFDFCEDDDRIGDVINDIGYFMNTMADTIDYKPQSCTIDEFRAIFESYYTIKHKQNKFDYDDMLTDCYYLLKNNKRVLEDVRARFKYILIDEFQDISPIQFEAIKLIAQPLNNVLVVGDDDQSIYGFRGAAPGILVEFEKLYPSCSRVILKQNYRSTKHILNCALALIDNNKSRYQKKLQPTKEQGVMPVIASMKDFDDEARFIACKIKELNATGLNLSDIAVIYRTNLQSRALVDAFMDHNIPFIAADGAASIYNHWVFKDIIAYLLLAVGKGSEKELTRVLNKPKRYISRDSIATALKYNGDFVANLITYCSLNVRQVNVLTDFQYSIKKMSAMKLKDAFKYIRGYIGYEEYLRDYASSKGIKVKGLIEALEEAENAVRNFDEIMEFLAHIEEVTLRTKQVKYKEVNKDSVRLLTMHKAKGLEFDVVFIGGAVEGLSPYEGSENLSQESLEEERRLFYVAATRAKQQLFIGVPKERYNKQVKSSRFVDEILNIDLQENLNLQIGQKVFHKIFMEGTITNILKVKDTTKLIIDFYGAS